MIFARCASTAGYTMISVATVPAVLIALGRNGASFALGGGAPTPGGGAGFLTRASKSPSCLLRGPPVLGVSSLVACAAPSATSLSSAASSANVGRSTGRVAQLRCMSRKARGGHLLAGKDGRSPVAMQANSCCVERMPRHGRSPAKSDHMTIANENTSHDASYCSPVHTSGAMSVATKVGQKRARCVSVQ